MSEYYLDDDFIEYLNEREERIYGILDRMRHDPKYRPVVKKKAAQGDAECRKVMVMWNEHVQEMRRLHARR